MPQGIPCYGQLSAGPGPSSFLCLFLLYDKKKWFPSRRLQIKEIDPGPRIIWKRGFPGAMPTTVNLPPWKSAHWRFFRPQKTAQCRLCCRWFCRRTVNIKSCRFEVKNNGDGCLNICHEKPVSGRTNRIPTKVYLPEKEEKSENNLHISFIYYK